MLAPVRTDCDQRHHAWPLFLRTYSALVDVLDEELRTESGLPLTWFDVLAHLAAAPEGRLRMHDLASHILLSKSGLTRLVDRMEAAGLVERAPCPRDRRVVYARLTARGLDTFQRAAPVAFRGVSEHFSRHLTPAEESAFTSALGKMLDALTCAPERKAV
jgi:DNA-binding MarR family transcriptional regulator